MRFNRFKDLIEKYGNTIGPLLIKLFLVAIFNMKIK